MTFLRKLHAHKGGLVRVKSELFWPELFWHGRGWDGIPGRVCLLIDIGNRWARPHHVWVRTRAQMMLYAVSQEQSQEQEDNTSVSTFAVLLLVDERPQWVLATEDDVELL